MKKIIIAFMAVTMILSMSVFSVSAATAADDPLKFNTQSAFDMWIDWKLLGPKPEVFAYDKTAGIDGTGCLKVTGSGQTVEIYRTDFAPHGYAVESGKTYTITYWIKSEVLFDGPNGNPRFNVRFRNDDNTRQNATTKNGEWTKVTGVPLVVNDNNFIGLDIFPINLQVGQVVYIDNIEVLDASGKPVAFDPAKLDGEVKDTTAPTTTTAKAGATTTAKSAETLDIIGLAVVASAVSAAGIAISKKRK